MTGHEEREFVDDARRYALDSRIATGGMGEVWRATDTVLDRTVAVKLLKTEYADDATFRSRFETEARHAASLHHPGVAAVYDFGEAAAVDGSEAPRPYLVMELVDGQPLSALLRPEQPLDPDATRDLLAQAADALGAAHAAGIVHRDVKPANLLVTPDRVVKITDFGIARATEGMALTETGQVMGTPQYISPEQAQGRSATPASDVYALGVVAFECLAGRRPFVADTAVATALAHLREPAPALPDDVPEDLARVVQRALNKAPEDRYPDGRAFAAALRDPSSAAATAGGADRTVAVAGAAAPLGGGDETQVLGSTSVPVAATPPPTGTVPAADRGRRTPWGWILLALAIVAVLVVVAVLASGGDDPEPEPPGTPTPTKTRESRTPEPSAPAPQPTPSEEPSETVPSQSPSPTPTEEPSETAPPEPSAPATPTDTASEEPTSEPTVTEQSPATEEES